MWLRILILTAILSLLPFGCDKNNRDGFMEYRTLTIIGRVYDLSAGRGLEGATIRFYAAWDSIGSTAQTDALGYYHLTAPGIICEAFAGTPPDYDPLYDPNDHYYIVADKTGYIPVTFGAWHAEIHCYDAPQEVNFYLQHSNDTRLNYIGSPP